MRIKVLQNQYTINLVQTIQNVYSVMDEVSLLAQKEPQLQKYTNIAMMILENIHRRREKELMMQIDLPPEKEESNDTPS